MPEDDIDIEPAEDRSPFSTFLRQERSRRPVAAILAILAVAVTAGALWSVFRSRETPSEAASQPALPNAAAPDRSPASAAAPVEPLELPELETSDAFVRRLLAGVSAHPQFAKWLVTEDLVRRFVATIVDIAHGSSPARHLRFMAPTTPFSARESGDQAVIDPVSYRRYDIVAQTFASLDTEGTARLIRQLDPLLEAAYREMGLPNGSFDDELARAFGNLLAVQVPEGAPVVVRAEDAWEWADPALEARSPAEKHLMRMGPQNARRVQAKSRDLAEALGLRP